MFSKNGRFAYNNHTHIYCQHSRSGQSVLSQSVQSYQHISNRRQIGGSPVPGKQRDVEASRSEEW